MTVIEFLTLAGSAGVISALLGYVIRYFEEQRSLRRHARLLAMKSSITLDQYFTKCAEYISDYRLFMESDGVVGELHSKLPQFPEIDEANEAWLFVDGELTDRIFRLKSDIENRQRFIDFHASLADSASGKAPSVASPFLTAPTVKEQLSEMAIEVFEIVKCIRHKYKFEEISLSKEILEALEIQK